MTNLIWILVILILIILLVIILIYLTFSDNKSNKRKVEYLKKEGKIIEAEITDIKSYTGGSVSAIPAIFLRIVARSFVHGIGIFARVGVTSTYLESGNFACILN